MDRIPNKDIPTGIRVRLVSGHHTIIHKGERREDVSPGTYILTGFAEECRKGCSFECQGAMILDNKYKVCYRSGLDVMYDEFKLARKDESDDVNIHKAI